MHGFVFLFENHTKKTEVCETNHDFVEADIFLRKINLKRKCVMSERNEVKSSLADKGLSSWAGLIRTKFV